MSRFALGLVVAAIVLIADQGSKWWMAEVLRLPEIGRVPLVAAGPFALDLTMVWNRGVTFGMLAATAWWHAWALAAMAMAIAALLLRWLWRADTAFLAVSLGAVIGGAVGNTIDRARWGAVFDFLDASAWNWHWYVFNVADAAIVLGVLALLADALFRPQAGAKEPA